jgi:hypothetical protein
LSTKHWMHTPKWRRRTSEISWASWYQGMSRHLAIYWLMMGQHFMWGFCFSNQCTVPSYDTLHTDDLGKRGHHLWPLLLDVLEDLDMKGVFAKKWQIFYHSESDTDAGCTVFKHWEEGKTHRSSWPFILQFVSIYICYLNICMFMKSELRPNSKLKPAWSSGPSRPAVPAYYNYLMSPMTNKLITSHLHFRGLIPVNKEASFPTKELVEPWRCSLSLMLDWHNVLDQ